MQGPPSPRRLSKAPRVKTLWPTLPLASAHTSARPTARRTVGQLGLPTSWGLTLTLGRRPRGPSQEALCRNTSDWGLPSSSAGLTLAPRCHTGPSGRIPSFRVGERAGPSQPPATFKGAPCQNASAHAPARQRPHLGLPLRSPRSRRIGTASLPGLTLTLGRPPKGTSQEAWRGNVGVWEPPSPSA